MLCWGTVTDVPETKQVQVGFPNLSTRFPDLCPLHTCRIYSSSRFLPGAVSIGGKFISSSQDERTEEPRLREWMRCSAEVAAPRHQELFEVGHYPVGLSEGAQGILPGGLSGLVFRRQIQRPRKDDARWHIEFPLNSDRHACSPSHWLLFIFFDPLCLLSWFQHRQ